MFKKRCVFQLKKKIFIFHLRKCLFFNFLQEIENNVDVALQRVGDLRSDGCIHISMLAVNSSIFYYYYFFQIICYIPDKWLYISHGGP